MSVFDFLNKYKKNSESDEETKNNQGASAQEPHNKAYAQEKRQGKKSNRKNTENKETARNEYEVLTLGLIAEEEAALREIFEKELNAQIESGQEIEEDSAKALIKRCISHAIAHRNILIGRIEKDIETGMLYDRYYNKLNTINELSKQGFVKYKLMKKAKDDWEYEEALYKKIRPTAYSEGCVPNDNDINEVIKEERSEPWEAFMEYGDGIGFENENDNVADNT